MLRLDSVEDVMTMKLSPNQIMTIQTWWVNLLYQYNHTNVDCLKASIHCFSENLIFLLNGLILNEKEFFEIKIGVAQFLPKNSFLAATFSRALLNSGLTMAHFPYGAKLAIYKNGRFSAKRNYYALEKNISLNSLTNPEHESQPKNDAGLVFGKIDDNDLPSNPMDAQWASLTEYFLDVDFTPIHEMDLVGKKNTSKEALEHKKKLFASDVDAGDSRKVLSPTFTLTEVRCNPKEPRTLKNKQFRDSIKPYLSHFYLCDNRENSPLRKNLDRMQAHNIERLKK